MRKHLRAALAAATVFTGCTPAAARPAKTNSDTGGSGWATSFWGQPFGFKAPPQSSHHSEVRSKPSNSGGGNGLGPRPSQWCGWYMRSRHGGGPEFNIAANWARYGSPASPQIGAIVVWPHHVGEIVGRASNGQWIVLSGNDSGGVQERVRSIAGAIVRI